MIEKVERFISDINQLHLDYSRDYFETGKIEKVNLKHTFANVPVDAILEYRFHLHESVNDYIMKANLYYLPYVYRVKTSESILHKIERFSKREEGYPVNAILNDLFGARIVLPSSDISVVLTQLDDWKTKHHLKNWYVCTKNDYTGIHIYFKNQSNYYYPWELQIWDVNDVDRNITSHRLYKRGFLDTKI